MANNGGGWELLAVEFVVIVDVDWFEVVFTVESLLLTDVCLDIGLGFGESTLCCFDIELLFVVDVGVFCETIVEYCRTGWVDVG